MTAVNVSLGNINNTLTLSTVDSLLGGSGADNITLSDLKSFGPFGFIGPRGQQRAANRWAEFQLLSTVGSTCTII